ncbi:MAG: hypothetical protein KDL87_00890, partial [Verrucomicrobiae bacterium]|nr:hypothetical protein [Verrucomicrobiae bacterium]
MTRRSFNRSGRSALPRATGWLLCVAAFSGLTLFGLRFNTVAQEAKPAEEKQKDPFANLPPETKKKVEEALERWMKAIAGPRQSLVEKRMLKTVEEMTTELRLNDVAVATLKEATKKAVEESQAPWREAMMDWVRLIYSEQIRENGANAEELISELSDSITDLGEEQIEAMLEEAPVSEKAHPANQNAWKAALEKALTPDQLAKIKEQEELTKRQAEKQFADLRDRMTKALETELRSEIKPAVDLVRNTIPMEPARSKAVDEAADAAVAEALAIRKKAMEEMLEKIPESARQQMMMNQGGQDFSLGNDGQEEAVPSKQKAWKDGLAKILTKDELADLKKAAEIAEKEEKKRSDEQLTRLIDNFSDNYRQNFSRQMDPLVADIRTSAKLDDARIDKLNKASESAVNGSVDAWKKKAKEAVDKMSKREREMMLTQGYVSVGWEDEDQPEKRKEWKDALSTILTPDEKKLWESAVARRKAEQKRVATKILVAALDERLAF